MMIWFDMDGTIADLYGVADWLPALIAEETRPYEIARGLGNLALIARLLKKVQANGHKVGIISWTSKGGSDEYNARVATAKRAWLARHLPSVKWDEVRVVRYGTNKRTACGGGILFDDEKPNRETWGEGAHEPAEIVEVLKALTR